MELLQSFQQSNSYGLFHLSKKLLERGFFKKHLSEYQFVIVSHILKQDNFELWSQFLEGNCILHVTYPDQKDDEDEDTVEEGVRPMINLAFHMRYILWEKAIDYFYEDDLKGTEHSLKSQTDESGNTYDLIDGLENAGPDLENPDKENEAEATKPVREEEDDYDDDDDDEDNGTTKQNDSNGENEIQGEQLQYEEGHVKVEIPSTEFITKSTPPPENNNTDLDETPSEGNEIPANAPTMNLEDQEALVKEFNKVYHNFEYDRETLIKRRKLEKSDMQIESQKSIGDDPTNQIPINLGSASHSLQHLLSIIQDRRDDVSLTDHDLKKLFMDVRKNRGKWANDERIGQEELYEACEKVLQDLRGYTEHSTPFLNKVSKREAPNYGLIIKTPMDLNTVMKKLKNLAYNSKQEFVDDLMLIWNNCLTYNADPKHYLRAHAIAMQKRTQKHIPTIPDITIRNRSEVEKEDDLDNDAKASTPALKGGKKSSKKGRMRKREEIIKSEEVEGVSDSQVSDVPSNLETPAPVSQPTPQENGTTMTEENPAEEEEEEAAEEADTDIRENENEDEQDPELQSWRTLTAKSRANYCASRAALFDVEGKLKLDSEAILRESNKMKNFNQFLDNKEVVSKSDKLLDNDEPYLLEYDVAGGIPGIKYPGVNDDDQDELENKMVEELLKKGEAEKLTSGFTLSQESGLNGLYTGNITEIQEIRKICFKISLIRQMQTQQYMHRTQMRQPEIEYIKEVDVDPVSKLPNHNLYTHDVQYSALRKSAAKVAMHTGFEATEPLAINTLTQIAERYMLNLAKSMKLHRESASRNRLSDKSIVLLTLLENGIERPDDLYTFVVERAVKQKAKLKDLRQKLSGFVKELLRPSLQNLSEQNFENNSEQFMTGDFANEIGDDFLGLKELGLDKEFKMLSSSIPTYLLHSRLQNSLSSADPVNKSTKYEDLKDWVQPKLTQADVQKQIGVLKPFYEALVQKSETFLVKQQKRKGESTELPPPTRLYLIEDEELPQKQRNIRPRLPPTGKITSVKKKLLSQAFILPDEDSGQGDQLAMGDDSGMDFDIEMKTEV